MCFCEASALPSPWLTEWQRSCCAAVLVGLAGNLPSRVLSKAVHREVSQGFEVCGNAGRRWPGVVAEHPALQEWGSGEAAR